MRGLGPLPAKKKNLSKLQGDPYSTNLCQQQTKPT